MLWTLSLKKAFVDGPSDVTGVVRQAIPFKWLVLTSLKIDIPRCPRLKTLRKAFKAAEIEKKWAATSWARKLASRKQRENLTDFDRFKLMVLRKKVRGGEGIGIHYSLVSVIFCRGGGRQKES